MLIVIAKDANPYYDDSYAVNSANLGPYGDALVEELYPYIEREFHAFGQPWARALYGGSTDGWRALALQIFHPDSFNGAWAETPDPDRLPCVFAGQHLRGRERVLPHGSVEAGADSDDARLGGQG